MKQEVTTLEAPAQTEIAALQSIRSDLASALSRFQSDEIPYFEFKRLARSIWDRAPEDCHTSDMLDAKISALAKAGA